LRQNSQIEGVDNAGDEGVDGLEEKRERSRRDGKKERRDKDRWMVEEKREI